MMLPTFTINDIRSWEPCYDPTRYLAEGWTGTALDVLTCSTCPAQDRLWAVMREDAGIPDSICRTWARWCALQVIDLWDAPEIVRCYLETGDETIRDAAWDAAWAAAWDAAGAAARNAAWDAARDAAWDAARNAAWDAAWAAQVDKLISMLQEVQ